MPCPHKHRRVSHNHVHVIRSFLFQSSLELISLELKNCYSVTNRQQLSTTTHACAACSAATLPTERHHTIPSLLL